ncbi:HAT dimerization [Penicillium robsamsonii]|uniref:HAT dimerization n=1 Tax=Penicillium robsamsonii TaxID=1792511 RepID=UPI00254918F2|nr:HAT dimerization [Penicillium robsamsonii]KAJ5816630.1 HAT dimerization [Penicillium robsamsonii]
MALMMTRDVIIYSVFLVYRKLLEHIERSNRRLKRKITPWKKDMYGALLVARQKLKEYYEKTYRDHGFLYGTGTLLTPQYCEYLRASFTQYQQQNPELLFRTVQRSSNSHSTELNRLLEPPGASIFHEGVEYDEVDQYLREGTKALKEDEALKVIEEDAEPISDNEEIKESENLEGNSEPEETY